MEVLTEWGVNIYKFKLDENDKILAEIGKSEMVTESPSYTEEWNAKMSRVITDNGQDVKLYVIQFLKEKIKKLTHNFNRISLHSCGNTDCICSDIWINIYKTGDFQGTHTHNNDLFWGGTHVQPILSFVYFAKYDHERDAHFYIGNPETAELGIMGPSLQITEEKCILVEQGDLIIFPSYLPHYVEKQKNVGPRITISGNIFRERDQTDTVCDAGNGLK
tara:strand:+ start:79 stop:735 length:657 start_codon:yes stop_codon:yes gene_type:complete